MREVLQKRLQQNAISFLVGAIFALGLGLSGMTQPQKVIGFLDPFSWDPSLIFVMVGAISVHAVLYPLVLRRRSPLIDIQWHVPTRNDITVRLVAGSAIFGIGWGLGGFCPGPGVTSLVTGDLRAVVFVSAMIAGMLLFNWSEKYLPLRK